MKKIFSFLVVCLLSSMATGVWAQSTPPALFSSADGTNEHWYNISFNRYTPQEMYWLVDHEVSGGLINRVLDENSANFQWKFVLVPGSTNQFYMVNKEYGEYVASVNAQADPYYILDSYGKRVPPALVDADGNPLVLDWDGTPRLYVNDSYVYYMDANSKNYAAVFEFQWSPDKSGWGIIDTGITDTWNSQPKNALNDWARSSLIVAVWVLNDDGSIVNIDPAGVAVLTTSTTTISTAALVNNSTKTTFTVKGRTLNGDITVAVEGPDAAAFKATPATFTTATKGGTVTVTFSPTAVRAHQATLRISSPGAQDKLVTLTGEVYQQSDMPQISAEGGPEHWYYIQFQRRAPQVIAANSDATDPRVIERNFNTGAPDPAQMWKICGDWNGGYYLVNKAKGQELLYNTVDTTGVGGSLNIRPDFAADRYFLPESGYGSLFDFVRFKTTNHWQLRNREVSAFGNTTSERRYVNEWNNDSATPNLYTLHHWDKNDDGNEIIFIPADKPLIKANPAFAAVLAPVGQTKTTTVKVLGLGTTGDISVSITGAGKDAFQVSPTSLPAAGGDVEITFTSGSETEYYAASLTLSSAGAADVAVPITGSYGGPIFSTATQDVWFNIQFMRSAGQGKVVQSNGVGKEISQVAMVPGDPNQQWKFTGTKDGLLIQNRAGGFFFYKKNADGTVPTDNHAIMNETDGDLLSAIYDPNANCDFGGPGLWEFKLLVNNGNKDGVNDYSQNIVGLWDAWDWNGNAVNLIPVETAAAHNPVITVDPHAINLAAQAGETVTAKVTVTGTFLTGDITAKLTGDGAANFSVSPSTLPAAGGELTVTFAPTDIAQGYKASLILSSAGIKDVTVPLAGVKPPKFSTAGNDVWYYIQFDRTANRTDDKKSNVWQWNGTGLELLQAQKENDFNAQQWKFVGNWKSQFVIENREGGQIYFDKQQDDLGVVSTTGNAIIADAGDPMLLIQNGSHWQLQLANFTSVKYSFLNDPGANGLSVGLWENGDGGNFVTFFTVNGTGIQSPSIDNLGQLLAVKIYTLQGIEVRQPAATGVYIVKKIYASGITQVVKQLIKVK